MTLLNMPTVLESALKKNFSEAAVRIVDCPDLSQAPFYLAAAGECVGLIRDPM